MKHLLTILLFLASAAQAQVSIAIDSATIGGIKFPAKATFECMIWNTRTSTVALQWKVEALGYDSTVVRSSSAEMIADMSSYVLPDGTLVGDLNHTLELYGIKDSSGNYTKLPNGNYQFTTTVMPEYVFYQAIAQYGANGATINQLIQAAGMRRKQVLLQKLTQ